jgi:hypothetical protein
MRACMQFRTQNVLEHGAAVLSKYEALIAHAARGVLPDGWRQPKWWSPEAAQRLAREQPPADIMTNTLPTTTAASQHVARSTRTGGSTSRTTQR